MEGIVPGVTKPVALAEKGYLTLMLTATGEGGHSSRPKHLTAIGKLARTIHRLETKLMPADLRQPVAGMFDYLASEMPFSMRAVAKALLDQVLDKGHQDGDNGFSHAPVRLVDHPAIGPFIEIRDIGQYLRGWGGLGG